MNTKSKAYSLSEQEFRTIIQNSDCCSTAMKQMGYKCTTGNSYNVVKRRINELQLDISHWLIGTQKANICSRIPDEEYFVKGYHHSGTNLCKRILETHKIEYKCAICGNTGEWNGKPLKLQVDHINGDHDDNRLENLRFLCPNCHTQTQTFAGKNVKHYDNILDLKAKKSEHTKEPKFFCKECGTPLKTNSKTGLCPICAAKKRRIVENRPSADTLLSQIKENGMSGTGRLYGVSDRAVAKWLVSYGLPSSIKELKNKGLL